MVLNPVSVVIPAGLCHIFFLYFKLQFSDILKRVSIITVNFNQPQLTEVFLNSVTTNNTYPATEIIVVDNGSRENSHNVLAIRLS